MRRYYISQRFCITLCVGITFRNVYYIMRFNRRVNMHHNPTQPRIRLKGYWASKIITQRLKRKQLLMKPVIVPEIYTFTDYAEVKQHYSRLVINLLYGIFVYSNIFYQLLRKSE